MTFRTSGLVPINTIYYAILDDEYVYKSSQEKYFVWTVKEFIDQVSYAVQDLENIVGKMESLMFADVLTERIDLVVPIQTQMQPGLLSYTWVDFPSLNLVYLRKLAPAYSITEKKIFCAIPNIVRKNIRSK